MDDYKSKLNHAKELLEKAYEQEVEENVIEYLKKQIAECERELEYE